MNKYTLLPLILIVTISGMLRGQETPYTEYQKILDVLENMENCTYEIQLSMFANLSSDEVAEHLDVKIWKGGTGEMFLDADEVAYYTTSEVYLMVDRLRRTVLVHQRSEDEPEMLMPAAQDFQPLIKQLGLFPLQYGTAGGDKGIVFSAPGLTNTEIRVEYDPQTYFPRKMSTSIDLSGMGEVYHEYDQKKVEATYGAYTQGVLDAPIDLSEVLSSQSGSTLTGGPFTGFTVVQVSR